MRGKNLALDRVSLQIASGEHVCILGPNGCGKSTLIKTITRECYPVQRDDSAIAILGRSVWNIFELRQQLGIVSPDQLAACTTDAAGMDVVLSGFFSSTRIFPNHHPLAEQRERAEAALARLGIAHLAERPVVEMSSGEAKRTLIARALVHEPKTLLLDEPGNALDIGGQLELRATLRELANAAERAGRSRRTKEKRADERAAIGAFWSACAGVPRRRILSRARVKHWKVL
jgi:iron complex transport system ATP-binding protein